LSSRVKGESMLDTVYTLQALHVDAFVIRDAEAGVPALVAEHVAPHVSVLSGGEADVSHPTQGLLDALTVYQRKERFEGLTVAIVMHPQPMNRGIEIASDVADGPQSAIRDQVRNGVAVRMAVLEEVLGSRGAPRVTGSR